MASTIVNLDRDGGGLEVGDCVALKGQCIPMTVRKTGRMVECDWFDTMDDLHTAEFPIAMLELVTEIEELKT